MSGGTHRSIAGRAQASPVGAGIVSQLLAFAPEHTSLLLSCFKTADIDFLADLARCGKHKTLARAAPKR